MKIKKIVNTVAQENTYILSNNTSCIIIDPGSNQDEILKTLKQTQLPLSAVLLTHAHFDHIIGLKSVIDKYPDTPIYIHESEKDWPSSPELNASLAFGFTPIIAPSADNYYMIDQFYCLGEFNFTVHYTPGHSIGGVSILFEKEKVVFSGDALFKNSIGRTDLHTGNHEQLITSIKTQLFILSDDYIVHSGHGEQTTIGQERQSNPHFNQ